MHLSPERPVAGLLAPLFALRSEHDLGIGDVAALRQFVDWAAKHGFGLVQLLPINETGNDNSPYNAISSVALEPTTLDLSPAALPDLESAAFKREVAGVDLKNLRAGPVNYREVKPLKLRLLERAFERFAEVELRRNTSRARTFRVFQRVNALWLDGYTLFRVLIEENGGTELWDQWKPKHTNFAAALEWMDGLQGSERKRIEKRRRFFAYVQWIAFTQWRELKQHCDQRGVALMGDVPFGVSYYSADVFSRPGIFDLKWSGGAPPEPYFKDDAFTQKWGQNWGVPIYRWDVLREFGFGWWRQRVRMVREIFHLFRVDHVLGFYRIYGFPWRPARNREFLPLSHDEARARAGGHLPHFIPRDDNSPESCEGNRKAGEEYLRILLEEVGAHRLIGEDLGTVPPYVRPSLTSLGIAGFKIPIWEVKKDSWLIDGRDYQRLSVATYATHDHQPLRALWDEWNQILTRGPDDADSRHARHEMVRLGAFAGVAHAAGKPWSDQLREAFIEALCKSNSWIVIFMITDIFGDVRRFNVPGTEADSNWSARLDRTVAQWSSDPATETAMNRIRKLTIESGRGLQ